jgi:hypothetical protein
VARRYAAYRRTLCVFIRFSDRSTGLFSPSELVKVLFTKSGYSAIQRLFAHMFPRTTSRSVGIDLVEWIVSLAKGTSLFSWMTN